jgi:hypothetical protein
MDNFIGNIYKVDGIRYTVLDFVDEKYVVEIDEPGADIDIVNMTEKELKTVVDQSTEPNE